ncbi:MAG: tRNA 2-thiouridine(34) synthase MnmA [Eubacteriales bacterium]
MDRVVAGMSGGVDSAVSAYLLKQQGYYVIGVFMKNWDEQQDGECTAAADYADVRDVCNRIGIPYYTVNFEKEYWDRVFSYFLKEYAAGRTPNPDVLCNQEIKFAAFRDFAKKTDAKWFATGHYARLEENADGVLLKKAVDLTKDQSYFLCMLNQEQLKNVLFPVGGMHKTEVREIALKLDLEVAAKKDSTGICFIGERKFKQFLQTYLPACPGEMRTLSGDYIGSHDGLMYYTLGQRRGLNIGGRGTGERWFVVKKDLENNVLYVEQGAEHPALYSKALRVIDFNWLSGHSPTESFACKAKFRYRQPDQDVFVVPEKDGFLVEFAEKQRAVTPGQYCVLYNGEICLGGGVIEEVLF